MENNSSPTRTLVVSNYCTSLDWLEQYQKYVPVSDTVIYSRTPEEYKEDYSHLGTYLKSPNVGENIYDILRYIIENYDNLSDVTVFIKGNLFSRNKNPSHNHPKPGEPYEIDEFYYTTRENYLEALTTTEYYPITRFHPSSRTPPNTLYTANAHMNFCGSREVGHKFFCNFHQMLRSLFSNPPIRDSVSYPPGANYVVPRHIIRKYSKELYQKLIHFVDWKPQPPFISTCAEAYLLERLLNFIWTENLVEKN